MKPPLCLLTLLGVPLIAACHPKTLPSRSIPVASSDAPWMQILKHAGYTLHNSPGWTRARLAYQPRPNCALDYDIELTQEREDTYLNAPASLPARDETLVKLRILPETEKSAALFLKSFPEVFQDAAPPGLRLDHFWSEEPATRLSLSPEALLAESGGKEAWERVDGSLGASLFFPLLPGRIVLLGEDWSASFITDTAPPGAQDFWMPWNTPTPVRLRLDSLYQLNGERVAVILAEWSREGEWRENASLTSPLWHGEEIGQATYLWLADRGWPLLAEVFVKTSVEIVAPNQPPKTYRFTFLGRSVLENACMGPVIQRRGEEE